MSTIIATDMPVSRRAALLGAFDAVMDLGLVVGPALCWVSLVALDSPLSAAFLL